MLKRESIGVSKALLSDAIERAAAPTSTCARLLVAGCLLSSALDAAATTYVVNTTGDPGPTGTTSFRQAVAAAAQANLNVVSFDNSLRDSTITLTQGVVVVANTNNILYIDGPGSRHLTISGNGTTPVLDFSSNSAVLGISGLTIKNGHLSSGDIVSGGGCLLAKYSLLELNDVVITGCSSDGTGGAVLLEGSTLDMHNSTITGNSSGMGGGGIDAEQIDGDVSSIYMYDSTVSYNTTYGYGAGIAASGSNHVRIFRSLISGNSVNSPADDAAGGGGISLKTIYKDAMIVNSTIANNYTNASGGGIGLFDAASAQVTQINFSTIVGNYSGYGYGGNGVHSAGTFSVANSIIANNFNRGDNVDIDGNANVNYSLILNFGSAHVSGHDNLFKLDPKLGTLTFNGGPTLTMLPKVGSPVINAGGSTGTVHNDQRGLPRPVGAASDMGAVERQTIEDEIFRNGFDSS